MLNRMVFAVSALILLAVPAAAQDCQSLGYEERQAVLRKAPNCDASMKAFSDCAYGASGDTGLGQIVTEKCEGDFLAKLGKAARGAYDNEIKACGRKYAKQDGSMYRAMAAGCRADVAQQYSRKFRKAAPKR